MEREEKPNVLYVQMFSTFYSASKDIQRLLTSLKIKGVFLDIFIDEPKKNGWQKTPQLISVKGRKVEYEHRSSVNLGHFPPYFPAFLPKK